MADDDDWFERALREDDLDEEPGADAERADAERADADAPGSADGDGDADTGERDGSDDESGSADAEHDARDPDDVFGGEAFGAAFENAPDPTEVASGGEFGMGGGEFGMGGGEFGMGGDEFGFGGSDGFDDEEFDSDIPRLSLGIEGLDEMILGGVPERSLMVAVGGAGTGKTTFGMQFLHEGLADGENAVFITLEETRERMLSTAAEKGWDFEGYEADGRLAVLDLDPIEMANSLTSIGNELPALVEEFGASRLVLDSVSLLEMMYEDQATRRNQIFDFTRRLKDAGVTTMLTSEADHDNPFSSRFGIIEYLTDAVFVLRYIRPEDFRETRLAVEIQKIRDAAHSRETKPYEITNDGISVYRQANIF